MEPQVLVGMLIGGAWVLREVLPLLLKRPRVDKHEPDYLPKEADARREQEWWEWRREVVNKRLDAHASELRELRDRLIEIERHG